MDVAESAVRPAVIFDFGGVLFRWNPAELLALVLADRVRNAADAEHWKLQFFQQYEGDWGAFDSGLIDVAELVRRIAARTDLAEAEVRAVVDAVPGYLTPQPGTVAVLRALKEAGHRLFFLSNMPAPYAEHLRRTHDFLGWFEDGVFSSEVKMGKPDAEVFKLALTRFGLRPEQALFIDDHPINLTAANALGLPAVLFTSAEQLGLDLQARGLLDPAEGLSAGSAAHA
ncbi:HAD family phosphatase [Ideonella azotifigens]|uniref:HAD family phosphatase n=1 Tax=Ideonella azotifigens TaxID=513160 RepID=A0ABN1K5S2_9BURK